MHPSYWCCPGHWHPPYWYRVSAEEEMRMLEETRKALEEELARIAKRIDELKKR